MKCIYRPRDGRVPLDDPKRDGALAGRGLGLGLDRNARVPLDEPDELEGRVVRVELGAEGLGNWKDGGRVSRCGRLVVVEPQLGVGELFTTTTGALGTYTGVRASSASDTSCCAALSAASADLSAKVNVIPVHIMGSSIPITGQRVGNLTVGINDSVAATYVLGRLNMARHDNHHDQSHQDFEEIACSHCYSPIHSTNHVQVVISCHSGCLAQGASFAPIYRQSSFIKLIEHIPDINTLFISCMCSTTI